MEKHWLNLLRKNWVSRMSDYNRDELASVSMQVILHSGNARAKLFEAVDWASKANFEKADTCMDQANDELIQAHKSQTKTIQLEAEGIDIPYSVLFSHAQDTLMTAKTEQNLIKEMIKLYIRLGEN